MLLLTITAPTRLDPLLFRIELLEKEKNKPQQKPDWGEQEDAGRPLICIACGFLITSEGQAVSRAGSHNHAFFNPTGIAFEVRCFQEAAGCQIYGEPTTEFTWFSGCSWQYAVCGGCRRHLGWFFSGGRKGAASGDSFFALIAGKID